MSEPRGPRDRPPNVDAAAFTPPDPNAPCAPPPAAGKHKSVVITINAPLLAALRTYCATRQESITAAVLTAHVEAGEEVQQALQPTDDDKDYVALGLAPRRSRGRLGSGKPLSLWLNPAALAALDTAAQAANVTRRRYVTELLTALLHPDTAPAEQPTSHDPTV